MHKTIIRRSVDLSTTRFSDRIPPLLQHIYAARGVSSECELENTLVNLSSPSMLKGIDDAVSILAQAVMQQKRLLVVGDFDADGATSSALSVLALQAMGLNTVDFLVPNRFEFGYGLTPEIVDVACNFQPDIIMTVDNGISSVEGVAAARQKGIKVIVTDHHLPGTDVPDADAIVNPNQHGCQFPSKSLAGVGVVFYVMCALRAYLRDQQWFVEKQIEEPNMAVFLDIVALGTVADVVPLDYGNRILVHQGLQRIRAGKARPGIMALLEAAGRSSANLVSADLGFAVGPRLNAAGRLDDMSLGIRCLLTDDFSTAREIAVELDDLNRDRKAIEASMQHEAMRSLQHIHLQSDKNLPWGLCLYDASWHQGVIGILASRIKDRFHRPVIAFAQVSDNEIKGSARSIQGLHIRDTLDAIAKKHPDLLTKFGGHAMAAGMSLKLDQYERFAEAFDQQVRLQLQEPDLQATLLSDAQLQAEELSMSLAQQLREAGPWGQQFPEPAFDGLFYIVQQRIVGKNHLKLILSPDKQKQQLVDAIAFNIDVTHWPDDSVERVKLVYRLDINEFRGQTNLQLMIDYIEPVSG